MSGTPPVLPIPMVQLLELVRIRLRTAAVSARQFIRGSRLRLAVAASTAVVFWVVMFLIFYSGFMFLQGFEGIGSSVKQLLTGYLFAFFFLALLVMMTVSSAIICYTSLYRNSEANFLMTLPLRAGSVFAYKAAESVVFTSWGVAVLVIPMIAAYGLSLGAGWSFYLVSAALVTAFIGIPMALGAVAALLVPFLVPRRRKTVLTLAAVVAVVTMAVWGLSVMGRRADMLFTEAGLKHVTDQIAFSQHWSLPSYWVSDGIVCAARRADAATGETQALGRSLFLLLHLVANVLFLGMAATRLGSVLYPHAWARAHAGRGGRGSRLPGRLLDAVLPHLLFFLPFAMRQLVIKDIKTFLRDPAQWSQCLLFFGLLGFYILNMPRFGILTLQPLWHSLVSLLNLAVTCLTLSTITSRFVFPQLSLEGRRIWIVGLLPLKRRTILWGKFFFAASGSLLISGALILMSDLMLGLPAWTVLIHLIVTACACCGLSGLAVGLGACYPHMRSDNPAKIVSSFGGTLNLICSIFFIVACVMIVALPLHRHAMAGASPPRLILTGICVALDVALAALVCLVPMRAGIRAFDRMEF